MHICRICLMISVVGPIFWINAEEVESRASPFGVSAIRWLGTSPSTSALSTSSGNRRPTARPNQSVCAGKCCKCYTMDTRVECAPSLNCQELQLGTVGNDSLLRFPTTATRISIRGFRSLKIRKDSFDLSQLQYLAIENVGEVWIEGHGLSRPMRCINSQQVAVIRNCSAVHLNARSFTGGWSKISIFDSKLDVSTSSFYQAKCLEKVEFENNHMSVRTNSFDQSKSRYLSMNGNKLQNIENHAFNLNIAELVNITNNEINEIQSEAFAISSPKVFNFFNNSVRNAYPHAFQMMNVQEKIQVERNYFGHLMRHVFHHLGVMKKDGRTKATFKDNTINKFDPDALKLHESLSTHSLQIGRIHLQMACDCGLVLLVDKMFLVSTTPNSSQNDEIDIKSMINDAVTCQNGTNFLQIHLFAHSSCQALAVSSLSTGVVVTISVLLCILFLLAMTIAIICCRRKRRQSEQRTTERAKMTEMTNSLVVMAIPETRIYKETELRIEEEFAIPLESSIDMSTEDS